MIRTLSAKQASLIERLAAERDLAGASARTAAWLPQAAAGTLALRDASTLIDLLFAAPRKAPAEGAAPAAKATPGYYVTDGGDVLVVVTTKDGERTYAKRLEITASDEGRKTARWVYAPGLGKTVAGIAPLTVEEAGRLGHKHGFCVVCAKALVDPKSVDRGIGPVCAKRLMRRAAVAA